MDSELSFARDERNGIPVLAAAGDIDLDKGPILKEALLDLVHAPSAVVAVDLTEVSFIDSTGLSAFLQAEREGRRLGVALRLVVALPTIVNLFRLTGLDEVFPLYATLEEAVTGEVVLPV